MRQAVHLDKDAHVPHTHPEPIVINDGKGLRSTSMCVEARGASARTDVAEATWVVEEAHRTPSGDDWVLVLGDDADAGHWRLSEVDAGADASDRRFAFQGRVFDTADADGDKRLEVRWSGLVLSRVVETFVRRSDTVIDAEIQYNDGTVEVITGTPEHPFYVPALGDYVELGQLAENTELHVDSGAGAILVGKTWRQGDFTVYNFEVENQHNYFVRAPGSESALVLVHNTCFTPRNLLAGRRVGHTFSKHGSHNTTQLLHEASGSGRAVGQWLDDAGAERLIGSYLDVLNNGAKTVPIPEGLGRVVNADGTFTAATHARLVPSGSGVKTAYPVVPDPADVTP